ncbi:hypothetical protein OTU49_011424 [Cherax quadricarinatus]|uniref:Uncharacterized protein n=2 Tax=Cherax quadricarinatus TaxID=27406 RepID=A0AAW0W628_CHEQU
MEWGQIILLSIWLLLMVDVCRTAGMEPSLKIMSRRKVLVISLDGFGHHYLDKYPWRYLATNLYSAGSYPRKFRNQFVTKTFPNHFSVATGLYEEVHGVIGNNIYDSSLNKTFGMDDKELFMQNPLVSPVWTLNEEHGGHSGCIMWPGCGVAYRGKNVTFLSPFHQHALFNESIDKSIEWFTNERTPANLIFLYHEEPDHVGHIYGPNSSQVEEELRKIDEGIGYLYQMLTVHKLRDTVDVIVMSDHGMSAVKEENVIFLDDIVDSSLYHISGTSPLLNVWTTFVTDTHGNHGYPVDIPNMEPIFVAAGPSFKRGFKAPDFSNIDTYMLLCHLLNLAPGPNNGTADNISSILVEPISSTLIRPLSVTLGCLVALLGLIGILACALTKKEKHRPVSAESLINGYVHRKTMRGQRREPLQDVSEEECLLDANIIDEV